MAVAIIGEGLWIHSSTSVSCVRHLARGLFLRSKRVFFFKLVSMKAQLYIIYSYIFLNVV